MTQMSQWRRHWLVVVGGGGRSAFSLFAVPRRLRAQVRLEGGQYNTGRGWIKLAHLPALNGGHHYVPVWPAGISFSPAADKVRSRRPAWAGRVPPSVLSRPPLIQPCSAPRGGPAAGPFRPSPANSGHPPRPSPGRGRMSCIKYVKFSRCQIYGVYQVYGLYQV